MAKNTLSFTAEKQEVSLIAGVAMSAWKNVGNIETSTVNSSMMLEGTSYLYDSTTDVITLAAGESITMTDSFIEGGNLLLLLYLKNKIIELRTSEPTFTATEETKFYLGALYYYTSNQRHYQITRLSSYYTDTSKKIKLKEGDKLKLTSPSNVYQNIVLLGNDGSEVFVFSYTGETFTAPSSYELLYLASKSSGVTMKCEHEAKHPDYISEYEGGSGILQLRHEMGARVKVYGDAGAGYMLIHEMEGKEIVRAVNMDGFNSLKFVSDGPVDTCIINEF
ncbi:MAG: hypothetical protein IJR86_01740 [Bacteroidaceae bacterium]|nr:hypothetical protein [Bacteroidaceae bacterium]